MAVHYAGWNIIIDDVVFPDGRTAMAQIGGGGFYATMGMRIWSRDVGLISGVGQDFDMGLLSNLGLDTGAVQVGNLPTARAWQVFEYDGTRLEIPRVTEEEWQAQLLPRPIAPHVLNQLKGVHFQTSAQEERTAIAQSLVDRNVFIGAEVSILPGATEEYRQGVVRGLHRFDLLSPDETEAAELVGERPVRDTLVALADYGPKIVALRQGHNGSTVYDREAGQFWKVPIVRTTVVDVTGAGNAYVGGFIVGMVETGSVHESAARAAVSASFVIEQVGPPIITPEKEQAARERCALTRDAVTLIEKW